LDFSEPHSRASSRSIAKRRATRLRQSAAILARIPEEDQKIGRSGIFIERACLKFLDPDADQVARDVVALRESVERLARNKFLGDLPYR
jgi:hypothetical protein